MSIFLEFNWNIFKIIVEISVNECKPEDNSTLWLIHIPVIMIKVTNNMIYTNSVIKNKYTQNKLLNIYYLNNEIYV